MTLTPTRTEPLTATWDEAAALDSAETILVNGWRYFLQRGQTPQFIAGLIETAVGYEPRLGLPMDTCTRRGCSVFVDEIARTADGDLFCSPECEDSVAEARFEQWENLRYADPTVDDTDGGRWVA